MKYCLGVLFPHRHPGVGRGPLLFNMPCVNFFNTGATNLNARFVDEHWTPAYAGVTALE